MWYGKVPNLSYLKVWGCEALVKRDTPDKLEQRSVKCIFIGYPKETMGYYFYFPPENKIVIARYVEFFEKCLISQEIIGRAVDLEEIQEEKDTTPSESLETFLKRWRVGRCYECRNAILIDYMVWVLVDLPPNCKTVGIKWIFKKKTDMDSNVHIYKAHLVKKGYTQTYMADYEETFSPVAGIRAIRILISIVAFYDYEIWQMDVKTAFLNCYLDEDIYMVQPEGFVDPKHPRKVCKLQRSIYELKQASRSWNKRFDEEIKRFGFDQNLDEPSGFNRIQVNFTWTAMKNILKYLRNTKDMFLVYGGNPSTKLRVECYCDAGFETDRDDTKSQSRNMFYVLKWRRSGLEELQAKYHCNVCYRI
ncbi:retrotransposon protein, putative, ty1-copia subclass [Tanacetum coccineum]